MAAARPILWHIAISHYSEKVRWALDLKQVPHRRRSPPPGVHMAVALQRTRGRGVTFPVLELDGRAIDDSTAIIAELERRFPAPALYPADPDERARALALEEHFDEAVGPAIRRFAFHEMRRDRDRFDEVAAQATPALFARFGRATGVYGRAFTGLRYGAASAEAAARARADALRGLDRLEAELDGRPHLVGDRFSVADLTAAAMLYPLVLPPEGPIRVSTLPEPLEKLRASLAERPGYRWVLDTYRRHRAPG